jgi:hypothetical protein
MPILPRLTHLSIQLSDSSDRFQKELFDRMPQLRSLSLQFGLGRFVDLINSLPSHLEELRLQSFDSATRTAAKTFFDGFVIRREVYEIVILQPLKINAM